MAAQNPVLSILNMQAKAPASLPQGAQPNVFGPASVNLTGMPAPMMNPSPPFVRPELPVPTTSLDLPQSLQGLLGTGSPQLAVNEAAIAQQAQQLSQTGTIASNPQYPALDFRLQPTYAEGGMVGNNGMPVRPTGMAGPSQPRMSPQMIEMQLQEFMRKQPQQVQQIANALTAGVQAGEITPEQLNMAGQLAMTALQNPDMYKYVRQFAIQQGLAEENDLSPEYDQGLIFVVLLAVRVAQQTMGSMGGMGTETGMAQQPMMSMTDGGYVTTGDYAAAGGKVVGLGTGTSDSIPIRVSAGEYVIPAHIVKAKGKDFFDALLKKYESA